MLPLVLVLKFEGFSLCIYISSGNSMIFEISQSLVVVMFFLVLPYKLKLDLFVGVFLFVRFFVYLLVFSFTLLKNFL